MTEREFSVCRWYDRLCLTSNEIFLPLYFARTRWLVMGGGAGSGKSRFAARKLIERCMSEAGHRMLVCRKVYATLRESCWALLKAEIGSYYRTAVPRRRYLPCRSLSERLGDTVRGA